VETRTLSQNSGKVLDRIAEYFGSSPGEAYDGEADIIHAW
jgi:hypothetical protein